jgi:hypothetical protein
MPPHNAEVASIGERRPWSRNAKLLRWISKGERVAAPAGLRHLGGTESDGLLYLL